MQISNLFKSKSKCFKLGKLHVKKIFEKLVANFFVELNINKTSILEYIGKNENCLLHFKDKKNQTYKKTKRVRRHKKTRRH